MCSRTTSAIERALWRTEATSAVKSWTPPMKIDPIRIHSSAGSQPNMTPGQDRPDDRPGGGDGREVLPEAGTAARWARSPRRRAWLTAGVAARASQAQQPGQQRAVGEVPGRQHGRRGEHDQDQAHGHLMRCVSRAMIAAPPAAGAVGTEPSRACTPAADVRDRVASRGGRHNARLGHLQAGRRAKSTAPGDGPPQRSGSAELHGVCSLTYPENPLVVGATGSIYYSGCCPGARGGGGTNRVCLPIKLWRFRRVVRTGGPCCSAAVRAGRDARSPRASRLAACCQGG